MLETYNKVIQMELLMRPITFNDLSVTLVDFIRVSHDKDWVSTYHNHPWFEFNYVSQGSVYTRIEEQEFLVESGSFYLIPPGAMHGHRHHEGAGDDGFCLRFCLEKVPQPDPQVRHIADNLIKDMSVYHAQPFYYAADRLLSDIEQSSAELIEATFIHWLLDIYKCIYPDHTPYAKDWKTSSKINITKQILMSLEAGYADQINVKTLADSLGYSYRHLARIFKEETGVTIIERLNRIRIAQAIELLNTTDMIIREISAAVGFQSEAYFSTKFREYTFSTPASYRKQHKQE